MKVLYVTNGCHDTGGGTKSLRNIICSLRGQVDCEVVFTKLRGEFGRDLERMGIKCHYFGYSTKVYPSPRKWYLWIKSLAYTCLSWPVAFLQIRKVAKRFKPDIIHTNVGPVDLGYRVAKSLGIPHVWHLREYMDKDFAMRPIPSYRAYVKQYLDPDNYCVAITDDIFRHFRLSGNSVRIYNGVISGEDTVPKPKSGYYLFAGSLCEAKGDFMLLKAFAEYVRLGGKTELWMAGPVSGERERELNDYAVSQGIRDKVKFLGYRSDVYSLMERARALVVPSRSEGFGRITAEAMYNHCLVIGRNTGGTKEQFDNGLSLTGSEIGIRFDEDGQLPHILLEEENKDREEMISRAYRTVMQLYTVKGNAEAVLAYYRRILYNQRKIKTGEKDYGID